MTPTPETLTRHELVGLHARVADAPNPDLVGISGRVVEETMRTLRVESEAPDASASTATAAGEGATPAASGDAGRPRSRVRQVPKEGTTFEFALPTECERERADDSVDRATDEAAGVRKVPGSASELGPETAGVRPGQSGPFAADSPAATSHDGECEGAVYVTVDGARLLSRPALRTERAGDSTWH